MKATPAQPKRSPQPQPPELESDRRADYTCPGYVLVGGNLHPSIANAGTTGNAIAAGGDVNVTNTISQLSEPDRAELKALLEQLQQAIANDPDLDEQDRSDASPSTRLGSLPYFSLSRPIPTINQS